MHRLAIALLALALLAAACSGGDEEIARVNGVAIRLSDVDALYEGDSLPIDEGLRQTLFRLVAVEALGQALSTDFGATVAPAAVEEYYAQLVARMTEAGLTPADFLEVADASQEMVRFNAELLALRDAAVEQLIVDPEVVDGVFADPAAVTTVCVRRILVETQEEAEGVIARLEAGEDFAAVAAEVSLETGVEGGELGCAAATTYVPGFAAAALQAPLGEVTGPVETEYGFYVLIVSERSMLTREEYLADPRALLTEADVSNLWTTWLNDALQAADVWVAERYGTWTPLGIEAPTSTTVPESTTEE